MFTINWSTLWHPQSPTMSPSHLYCFHHQGAFSHYHPFYYSIPHTEHRWADASAGQGGPAVGVRPAGCHDPWFSGVAGAHRCGSSSPHTRSRSTVYRRTLVVCVPRISTPAEWLVAPASVTQKQRNQLTHCMSFFIQLSNCWPIFFIFLQEAPSEEFHFPLWSQSSSALSNGASTLRVITLQKISEIKHTPFPADVLIYYQPWKKLIQD